MNSNRRAWVAPAWLWMCTIVPNAVLLHAAAEPLVFTFLILLFNSAAVIGVWALAARFRWFLPFAAVMLFAALLTNWFFLRYGSMPAIGTWLAISQTNCNELWEFMPASWRPLLFGVFTCTLFIVFFLRWPISAKIARNALAANLLLIALVGLGLVAYAGREEGIPASRQTIIDNSYPLGVVLGVPRFLWYMNDHPDRNLDFRFGALRNMPLPQDEIYVLVIGESAAAAYWPAAGYQNNTTPKMQNRFNRGEAIFFKNAVAQANATALAVPMIVTAATPNDFSRSKSERSMLSAFNEVGFQTYWISNQDRIPFSADAGVSHVFNDDWHLNKAHYDQDLLPIFDQSIGDGSGKRFIVVHLMGSHVEYAKRVPTKFNCTGVISKSQQLVRDYEKSICYTDWVLDQLISTLEKSGKRSFLWYVSDHGQIMRNGEIGHGTLNASINELHIPMFIWGSPELRDQIKLKSARALHDSVIAQGVVFPSLLDLAEIQYPGLDYSRDIFSGAYDRQRKPSYLNINLDPVMFDRLAEQVKQK